MARQKGLGERGAVLQDYRSKIDLTQEIRRVANELYEKRGRKPGHEVDDWLEAERLVKKNQQWNKK